MLFRLSDCPLIFLKLFILAKYKKMEAVTGFSYCLTEEKISIIRIFLQEANCDQPNPNHVCFIDILKEKLLPIFDNENVFPTTKKDLIEDAFKKLEIKYPHNRGLLYIILTSKNITAD